MRHLVVDRGQTVSGFEGLGFMRNGVTVMVTTWPQFKKPILTVRRGNEETKVASFNSESEARFFIDAFCEMADGLLGGVEA